jgi:hypothetical protein
MILKKEIALGVLLCLALTSRANKRTMLPLINDRLAKAEIMSLNMAKSLEADSLLLPRTFENGKLITSDSRWWCSGFFPGVLWYLYENNRDNLELKKMALKYTKRVENQKYTTDNHDIGFMIFCSFGNGLRIDHTPGYREVILQATESLSKRYTDHMQLIRSWDWNGDVWQYPVIIDNMMNLEILMWSSKQSGNKRFEEIATNHADKTMKNHFRSNYSCYHLVDYDTITAQARLKQTVQGFSDSSSWARGQAWALYGYTMMYRETGLSKYLTQAENIAQFIVNHPRLPKDKIPYWDFDAPNIPDALRDASAGAIMASAFIELSKLSKNKNLSKKILKTAEQQIISLSSEQYFANIGTNGNFILKHSVGSLPGKTEVDVPLTYADYYYIEALIRYKKMIN